ncbi:hypothetical protein NE619_11250 [Anaerovorax odorimutans]|uniref:DUF2007 domain-containing protein n=1 Tax=Anaerovorax odorimutans TaxID=109327 RepID=A0ABT1RQ48_9FIRM|nr:hypothetical protein [Anaerovorax odorimutans]MCQ4637300.1 hypothetical protein [Anaerovorax odorimutans]
MFNKETVYQGYSLGELAKVRNVLAQNGIKYKVKTNNGSGGGSVTGGRRGITGPAGMQSRFERQYEVVVNREDAEQARYLINEDKHK